MRCREFCEARFRSLVAKVPDASAVCNSGILAFAMSLYERRAVHLNESKISEGIEIPRDMSDLPVSSIPQTFGSRRARRSRLPVSVCRVTLLCRTRGMTAELVELQGTLDSRGSDGRVRCTEWKGEHRAPVPVVSGKDFV